MNYITKKDNISMLYYKYPVYDGKKSTNGNGTLAQPLYIPSNTNIQLVPNTMNVYNPNYCDAIINKWGLEDPEDIYTGARYVVDITTLIREL